VYPDDYHHRGTRGDVDASGLWPGKVVTEVAAAGLFWEAEEDDQEYLHKHPDAEACHFVRPGWKLPRQKSRNFLKLRAGFAGS
jgi:peptide-methionine (S)-S-oxide reductase